MRETKRQRNTSMKVSDRDRRWGHRLRGNTRKRQRENRKHERNADSETQILREIWEGSKQRRQ